MQFLAMCGSTPCNSLYIHCAEIISTTYNELLKNVLTSKQNFIV